MTVYTVHLQGEDAQHASFVPEGFARDAFFFAPLWALGHRLWFAFLLWCAAMVIIFAAPLGLSFAAKEICAILIAFLYGLEGSQWRREKLIGQGKEVIDIVSGDTFEDAETHFFHRWAEGRGALPVIPPSLPLPAAHAAAEAAFGVFPEPERRS
jgi:hypothetical protein